MDLNEKNQLQGLDLVENYNFAFDRFPIKDHLRNSKNYEF
jgi:hypothetical protein